MLFGDGALVSGAMTGKSAYKYATYALQSDPIDCDLPLDESIIAEADPYPASSKPVFVGHYWLCETRPEVLATNVACLDYSVAKEGFCAPIVGMANSS